MRIILTEEEMALMADYAKRFYEHKGEQTSKKKQFYQGDDPLYPDKKGFTAEFAVHKFFGVEMPDFNPEYTKKDMLLGYKGKELVCDIKSTIYSRKDEGGYYKALTINEGVYNSNLREKEIDAFIGVEVWKDLTTVELHGIISWENFLKHKERFEFNNGGYAPCVPITELMLLSKDFTYLES